MGDRRCSKRKLSSFYAEGNNGTAGSYGKFYKGKIIIGEGKVKLGGLNPTWKIN